MPPSGGGGAKMASGATPILKGSKLCSWDVTKQHLYSVELKFNTESFPGIILTRSRDTYYITRCSCSWPLLLLHTTAATPRLHRTEAFSDKLKFAVKKI